MGERIGALCLALSNVSEIGYFNLRDSGIGASGHAFGEVVNRDGPFSAVFKQLMLGISIDHLLVSFKLPFPNHIKIDVDGIESKIIEGAKKTIADHRLKSMLVEMDTIREDRLQYVFSTLDSLGMTLKLVSQSPHVEKNYIFVRS